MSRTCFVLAALANPPTTAIARVKTAMERKKQGTVAYKVQQIIRDDPKCSRGKIILKLSSKRTGKGPSKKYLKYEKGCFIAPYFLITEDKG